MKYSFIHSHFISLAIKILSSLGRLKHSHIIQTYQCCWVTWYSSHIIIPCVSNNDVSVTLLYDTILCKTRYTTWRQRSCTHYGATQEWGLQSASSRQMDWMYRHRQSWWLDGKYFNLITYTKCWIKSTDGNLLRSKISQTFQVAR